MRRLTGLESEYAISFRPETSRRPSNARVYNAIMRSVADAVHTVGPLGDEADAIQEPVFVQNGGAFNYEVAGAAFDGGLLEGATPECTSAFDVVTYQRAQGMILRDALNDAEADLRA
ncbi:MAG: proteasome accessory factor PafA2 family protein, partial [Nannocystaceae bacterium]|nr:proteasome accessory factor PafA2 family protein [Nannocystaceae bacterium]